MFVGLLTAQQCNSGVRVVMQHWALKNKQVQEIIDNNAGEEYISNLAVQGKGLWYGRRRWQKTRGHGPIGRRGSRRPVRQTAALGKDYTRTFVLARPPPPPLPRRVRKTTNLLHTQPLSLCLVCLTKGRRMFTTRCHA